MMKIYKVPRESLNISVKRFVLRIIPALILTALSAAAVIFIKPPEILSKTLLAAVISVTAVYIIFTGITAYRKYIRQFTSWAYYNGRLYIISAAVPLFGSGKGHFMRFNDIARSMLNDTYTLKNILESGKGHNDILCYEIVRISGFKENKNGACFHLDDGRKAQIYRDMNNYNELAEILERISDMEFKIKKVKIEL